MPYIPEDIIEVLYRLYEQIMYYEAYKILHDNYLAEDAVHEAFLKLIRNRNKIFDPHSPTVRRYVVKTVKSTALDIYRNRKKPSNNCTELDDNLQSTYNVEEMNQGISLAMINDLPNKYASVVRCLFFDELSIKETAAILKIREDLVRKRLERARKLLKKQMNKELQNEK